MKKNEIKKLVRQGYGQIAKKKSSCCSGPVPCCSNEQSAKNISQAAGYSNKEINSVPQDANLGLGCGHPVALASLKKGETVLDLGSGPGMDCFLAAQRVGPEGKVIGIDMTPEMIKKARANAQKANYQNVEFRLAEIENLPVPDNSVDIIISNCVINLSPDKKKVFKEAFRVLKPGGRLMISDLVLERPLPIHIQNSAAAYISCLAGAVLKKEYLNFIKKAGFQKIKIVGTQHFPVDLMANDSTAQAIIKNLKIKPTQLKKIGETVVSIKVSGIKTKK